MDEITGEAVGVGEVATGVVSVCSGFGVGIDVSTTNGLIDGSGVGIVGVGVRIGVGVGEEVGVGVVRVAVYMHLNVPFTQLAVMGLL